MNYQKQIDAQFQKYVEESETLIQGSESQEKMIMAIKKLEQSLIKKQYVRKFCLEIWNCKDDIDSIKLYLNFFGSMVQELPNNIEKESNRKTEPIYILHLSGLYIETSHQAKRYCVELKKDLLESLKVNRLDYLVISGDIVNNSNETEYKAARDFVDELSESFNVEFRHIIIVPGDHDINYEISHKAHISRKMDPVELKGLYTFLEDGSLRNEEVYKTRFANFNKYFYEPICKEDYSSEYSEQAKLHPFNDHQLLFFTLNSAWEIDHQNQKRAGVNSNAFYGKIDELIYSNTYKDWLKITVLHHPLNGSETINPESKEQINRYNFHVIMHGHIHEAIEEYHKPCQVSRIIGAGTFGMPVNQQVSGIPLQYNLLKLNPNNKKIIVNTRKRKNIEAPWEADKRWGKKNKNLKPNYGFVINEWGINMKDDEKAPGSELLELPKIPSKVNEDQIREGPVTIIKIKNSKNAIVNIGSRNKFD